MTIEKLITNGCRSALVAGGLGMILLGDSACIRDTDCGICDPDNLILESISGVNYASQKIHVLGPECEGDRCPGEIKKGSYFVNEVIPCEETELALESPRGTEEYCKISPLVVAFGLEFVFNNLLESTSVELVRKRPDQPKLFEVYDWKTNIVDIVGPTTRYNGDFTKGASEQPDIITRLVNLSCIDNLGDEGLSFGAIDYKDPATNPCNAISPVTNLPRKMRVDTPDAKLQSYRGMWNSGGSGCDTPQEGADTCCSECDFLLSTRITKYGLDEAGNPRNVNDGTAIACDATMGDSVVDCRTFVPSVNREDEDFTYSYYWDAPASQGGTRETSKVALYDRVRETHFDARPAHLENFDAKCNETADCDDVHDLPGTRCVGQNDGVACTAGPDNPDCTEGVCRAEWFVGCAAPTDTTGGAQGYCVDRRFSDSGAAACFTAAGPFDGQCDETGDCTSFQNRRLANCNGEANDPIFSAAECCQETLGGVDIDAVTEGIQCDPYLQPGIRAIGRYDRNDTLPGVTRACVCEENPDEECADVVDASCRDENGNIRPDRDGEYAVLFVERPGGVVYDPAIKGVEWRPGDLGGVPRADIESCAEGRSLIGARNRHDGWRANDTFIPENFEEFDRAMCSGSTYTVTFATPGEGEYIRDKVGNSLEGKNQYTFETPQFHVVPGSGFPTDNLRIGACDNFSIRFSNKYDMSPENQRKIAIYRVQLGDDSMEVEDDELTTPNADCSATVPVAGGPGCVDDPMTTEGDPCAAPCLTVDVSDQATGEIRVAIDSTDFGTVLQLNETYRVVVPGLGSIEQMREDPGAYQAAFWDACGMPLVVGGADEIDFAYQFKIDEPKCKEDADQDGIQLSCDNAPNIANRDQEDIDFDGVGDVIDLCPTIVTPESNTGDSDKDGVGNECDSCRQTVKAYADAGSMAMPDAKLRVRNVPAQLDTDEDGIGDVCDNCVQAANCENYGPDNPYRVGEPIDYNNANRCQRDDDQNLVGDACMGAEMLPNAGGPIGFGGNDDFDQDGLINMIDGCPRQPVEFIDCSADATLCPEGASCESLSGTCSHVDSDGDTVGDICDTCPNDGNGDQVTEGGMQDDDADEDFVGSICETNAACSERKDARLMSFYQVSANNFCCTVQLVEDPMTGDLINVATQMPLRDPNDLPIRLDCIEPEDPELAICRALPQAVARVPGVLTPPAGCEQALADAGLTATTNPRLTPVDVPNLDTLWNTMCFLPQLDQDFDGYGDLCDLCDSDFDPQNQEYIDANGRVWPDEGKFCNGEYSIENKCEDEDTGTGSGSGSGSESGGGSGGSDTGVGTSGG